MLRRMTALALWAYFAWYLGALIADATGLSPLVGPVAAAATGAFALYDWHRPRMSRQPSLKKELQVSR